MEDPWHHDIPNKHTMMPPRSSKRILRIVLLSLTSSSPCAGANAPLPALAFVPLNNLQLVEQTTASFAAKSPLQNRWVCRCSLNGAHPPSRRREYLSRLASIGGRKNRTSGRRSIGVSTGLGLPARKTWRKLSTTTPMLDNDEGTVQSIQPDCDGGNRGSTSKNKTPNLAAYWDMLRPHNVPASFGLVAAGALAASHRIATILDPKVLSVVIALRDRGGRRGGTREKVQNSFTTACLCFGAVPSWRLIKASVQQLL